MTKTQKRSPGDPRASFFRTSRHAAGGRGVTPDGAPELSGGIAPIAPLGGRKNAGGDYRLSGPGAPVRPLLPRNLHLSNRATLRAVWLA